MIFPTAPNEKAPVAADETSYRLKVSRVEENAAFLVASYKDLALRNDKLHEELQEAQAQEVELRARTTELEEKISLLESCNCSRSLNDRNETEGNHQHRAESSFEEAAETNQEEGTSSPEEIFMEQMIRRIKDSASTTDFMVPLYEYQRLHRVYLAIKEENKKLGAKFKRFGAKYAVSEQDRMHLKHTVNDCYEKLSPRAQKDIKKRLKKRKKRCSSSKRNTLRSENIADKEESLPEDSVVSSQTSFETQQPSTLPDRTLSPNKSLVIEERLSMEVEDLVNRADPGAAEEKQASTVAKITNSDCEDRRDEEKECKSGSCIVNDRRDSSSDHTIKMTCNRFDWVRFLHRIALFDVIHFVLPCLLLTSLLIYSNFYCVMKCKWWEQEDSEGLNLDFRQYVTELLQYRKAFGDFDVLPDHVTLGHVGNFVAFVRAEHKKNRKEDEALITAQEIELLDSIGFEWDDSGIRNLVLKRKRPNAKWTGFSKDHV